MNYTLMRGLNAEDPTYALLYGAKASLEYNLITDDQGEYYNGACNMYTIASDFNSSNWDYSACLHMIEYAKNNSMDFSINSIIWGGHKSKHP